MKRFLFLAAAIMFSVCVIAQQDTLPAPTSYNVNGVTFRMVKVEKGDFWMGAQHVDTADFNFDRLSQSDEVPVHNVKIKEDFYIGQTEVTQKLWKAVMGSNPSKKKCPKRPVENVSYYDIQEFLVILDSLTGMNFRLPTEAEWEYAARGGKNSRGYIFSGSKDAERVAWFTENARKTKKVGKRSPNELGLYDMSGNVWEWCDSPYRFYDAKRNANIGRDGQMYCIRGGAWQLPKTACRVTWRGKRMPDSGNSFGGFRLCLDSKYVKEEAPEPELIKASDETEKAVEPKLSRKEKREAKKAARKASKEAKEASENLEETKE